MGQKTNPCNWPLQNPGRVVIFHALSLLASQQLLKICNRVGVGEACLAQVDLIAVLQRAEQFHAIERAEI